MQHSHLRNVLVGPVAMSRAQIVWPKAIVTATIAAAITFACIQLDQVGAALPLVIGAAFVGLANAGGGTSQEIKGMAWCLLWVTIATLIGGLAATLDMALVLIAVVMALVAGFAGALGKRGSLIGVLSLVLFVVFSGAPDTERTAISSAVLVAIGGILQLLIGGAFALLSNRRHPITQQAITQQAITHQVMTEHVSEERRSVMDRLREHTRRESQFARHALRLAVAVGVATVIAQGTGWPHEYWIPMTVVWMSRPDKNGTSTRVVERTLGTFLGIGISLLFIDLIGTSPIRIALYIFIGTLFAIAFINANYPIAVGGITLIVITLFTFDGEPLSETVPYRILSTLVAAIITIAASFLWTYKPPVTDPAES